MKCIKFCVGDVLYPRPGLNRTHRLMEASDCQMSWSQNKMDYKIGDLLKISNYQIEI